MSKGAATATSSKLALRSKEFLEEFGIDYRLNSEATSIDRRNKQVVLKDGTKIPYDKLLIATGGDARVPRTPGIDLKNVHVLRSAAHQD